MIRLGTSGFSYDDWVGPFYPQDLPKQQWLSYYAAEFDTVELNVSYYRVPSLRTVTGWVERTPENFLFSVKAHRSITHDREGQLFGQMQEVLEPMVRSGKLGCILAQFPYSFHRTEDNYEYLKFVRKEFWGLPLVVEFRNEHWIQQRTFDFLAEWDLGFCCVDEPRLQGLIPPVVAVTGSIGYVRFHGRNAKQWWNHDHAWQRYDYQYNEEELQEWLPHFRTLKSAAPLTLVYANNHYKGKSVETQRALQKILAGEFGSLQ
ncbi:MAG: DUF72 domain-containing protein [Anaerolineales bacterium]|nr:DUF72 domain-containing protein [Anaerolineales bacterium]